MRREFENAGYDVTEASDFEQAMAILDKRRFDVVVSDMRMEDEDSGVKPARRLKSPYHDGLATALVIFTAHPDFRDCVEVVRAGAYDYVRKRESDAHEKLLRACEEGLKEMAGWASDPDYDYVQNNFTSLLEEHGECWVAVRNHGVIAHAPSLTDLNKRLRSEFPCAKPYIARIEGAPVGALEEN